MQPFLPTPKLAQKWWEAAPASFLLAIDPGLHLTEANLWLQLRVLQENGGRLSRCVQHGHTHRVADIIWMLRAHHHKDMHPYDIGGPSAHSDIQTNVRLDL